MSQSPELSRRNHENAQELVPTTRDHHLRRVYIH